MPPISAAPLSPNEILALAARREGVRAPGSCGVRCDGMCIFSVAEGEERNLGIGVIIGADTQMAGNARGKRPGLKP